MSDNAYNIRRQPASSMASGTRDQEQHRQQQQQAQAPLSVVSIVGLVLPFVCLWPAGLACSIIGLVQTKDGMKRGRGIAIAGTVVNALFALMFIATMALNGTSDSDAPANVTAQDVTAENAQEMADALEREVDGDSVR